MEIEFDVKIDAASLYDYMMHHTFTGFSGVLKAAVGALLLVAGVMSGGWVYLAAGLILLVYQPASLYLRARKQALNPVFKEPLHYRLTEEGVEVSQKETKEFQKWEDMFKAVSTNKSIILYTSRINASIFPKRDLKDALEGTVEMIATHMPAGKVNIRL